MYAVHMPHHLSISPSYLMKSDSLAGAWKVPRGVAEVVVGRGLFKFKFKVHMPSVMEDEYKHIKTNYCCN